eukprot:scaffold117241_cov32-Tisochrysis_lutea.AAC.4
MLPIQPYGMEGREEAVVRAPRADFGGNSFKASTKTAPEYPLPNITTGGAFDYSSRRGVITCDEQLRRTELRAPPPRNSTTYRAPNPSSFR